MELYLNPNAKTLYKGLHAVRKERMKRQRRKDRKDEITSAIFMALVFGIPLWGLLLGFSTIY